MKVTGSEDLEAALSEYISDAVFAFGLTGGEQDSLGTPKGEGVTWR